MTKNLPPSEPRRDYWVDEEDPRLAGESGAGYRDVEHPVAEGRDEEPSPVRLVVDSLRRRLTRRQP